jgi:hypothetical protein
MQIALDFGNHFYIVGHAQIFCVYKSRGRKRHIPFSFILFSLSFNFLLCLDANYQSTYQERENKQNL